MLMTLARNTACTRMGRDAALLPPRYYDTTIGRFTSLDTFEGHTTDPLTLDRYAYAQSDPVILIDPSGHEPSLVGLTVSIGIGATIGAIGGAAYTYYHPETGYVRGVLVGAGLGASAFAALYLGYWGFAALRSGAMQRFFWDPRTFQTISRNYWAQYGPANGSSLHHWLIPQRWTWISQGFRNAGFNLLELPKLIPGPLGLNQWMGFALRWGGRRMVVAVVVENGIRILIPVTSIASYHAGKWLGNELATEALDLGGGATATPIQLSPDEELQMEDDAGNALEEEVDEEQ